MCCVLMQRRFALASLLLPALVAPLCLAQQTPTTEKTPAALTPATAPTTAPAPLRPLNAKVLQVLTQSREAYKALKSYQDLGRITTTMVVSDRPAEATMPASTTFRQPGRFISSYEAMTLYCDSQTLWIYVPARSRYYQQPAEQAAATQPAGPTPQSLMRNLPVLMMLTHPDESLLATTTAFDSTYRGQEQLAGKGVEHVTLLSPADAWFGATDAAASSANRIILDLFFDAQTHMLLRLNIDMTEAMRNRIAQSDPQRGPVELSQATWQFNAGQVRLNTPIAEDTFTFKAPSDAEKVETVGALFAATTRSPINDEEAAERREAEQTRLPYPAPDFTLPDLSGQEVKLSDLRGKVVVLDFWATWCGPCRVSLPHIQQLSDDFKSRSVVVLGIDLGEDAKTVLAYAEKNKMTFRILLDEQDQVSPLYHVSAIPHTIVIDQKGQVVKVHTGFVPGQENTLRSEVEALLGGTASQPATRPAATQPAAEAK